MADYAHIASYGGIFFRKSQAYIKASVKPYGISFVDTVVLINVCENPGIIQEKIAYNLALDDAAVARSLKHLESLDLVERTIDEANQRTKKVTVRPKGEKLKVRIDEIMLHWNNMFFEGFDSIDHDNIVKALFLLRERALEVNVDQAVRSFNYSESEK